MADLTAARIQATRAKDDMFIAMQTAVGAVYAKLSTDYVTATKAESEAHTRELAAVLHPQVPGASTTLAAATKNLKDLLDKIAQNQEKIENATGAINAILGAVLLFSL